MPLAPPLWFARVSAVIKALGGVGLADADDAAWLCGLDPDRPLTRAHVPAPAASRTRAARAAIQPRRANQRRRGPVRPAVGGRPSGPPAWPGGVSPSGRRCETTVSPCLADPACAPAAACSCDTSGGRNGSVTMLP